MRSRLFHAIVGVAVAVAGPSSIGCSDPARSDAALDPPPADSITAESGGDASEGIDTGAGDGGLEETAVRADSAAMTDVGADTRADADSASDGDAVADVGDAVTDVPTNADAEAGWHPTK